MSTISADLDSVINVLGLSPQDPLDTFVGQYAFFEGRIA